MEFAIGIDIGGTKVAIGLVDREGTIHARRRFAMADVPSPRMLVERIAHEVKSLTRENRPVGLGIGCPGPMDLCHGVLLDDATLPQLYGVDLVAQVRELTHLETWMENDADAALLGETWRGDLGGVINAVMLTFGTGLGGAAIVQGRLLRGHRGMHPEVAMLKIPASPSAVAEQIVAGPAIDQLARSAGFATGAELLQRATLRDPHAMRTLQPVREAMGQVIWNVLHCYAPEVVILGGGVMAQHYALFAGDLIASARAAYMVGGTHLRLQPAVAGNEAGIIGAARMILDPETVQNGPRRDGLCQTALIPCENHEAMSQAAAQRVLRFLGDKPDALICPATGHTPRRLYELLAAEAQRRPGLFAQARVIKLDEWGGIRADPPSSREAYLQQYVVQPWRLDASRYAGFAFNPPDANAECQRIASWLGRHGPIDLAILGIGISGHIGFNEPAERMIPGPHPAKLTPESLAHPMLNGENREEAYGMTLGVGDLLRAGEILLLAGGPGKAQQFARFTTGPVTPRLPVSMVHLHPRTTCLYDSTSVRT